MCQFCTSHGEGKAWYLNMRNYTEEVFRQRNSPEKLQAFFERFSRSLATGPVMLQRMKRRFPRIYGMLVRPVVTRMMQRTHFGQVVPVEEIEQILDSVGTIVRLPCVCRRVTTGKEHRLCFGVGLDLTPVLAQVPEFASFERMTAAEAKAAVRRLDDEGKVHSVWTFETPFIAGICNCDRDCMAYRTQVTMDVATVMWRAEHLAAIDPLRCTGCRDCMKRCYFGAIRREGEKCRVDATRCYGCGVCRNVCGPAAIGLVPRASVPGAAGIW